MTQERIKTRNENVCAGFCSLINRFDFILYLITKGSRYHGSKNNFQNIHIYQRTLRQTEKPCALIKSELHTRVV